MDPAERELFVTESMQQSEVHAPEKLQVLQELRDGLEAVHPLDPAVLRQCRERSVAGAAEHRANAHGVDELEIAQMSDHVPHRPAAGFLQAAQLFLVHSVNGSQQSRMK